MMRFFLLLEARSFDVLMLLDANWGEPVRCSIVVKYKYKLLVDKPLFVALS